MPTARQAFDFQAKPKWFFETPSVFYVLCLTWYNHIVHAVTFIDRFASRNFLILACGWPTIWLACQPRARLVAGVADVVRAEQPWALTAATIDFSSKWTRCNGDDVCVNTARLSAPRFSSH